MVIIVTVTNWNQADGTLADWHLTVKGRRVTSLIAPHVLVTLRCYWSYARNHRHDTSLCCLPIGPWAGADNLQVGCTPPYKGFCCRFLWFSISIFLFQFVSSFKSCPFGLEIACFNSSLWCRIRSAKISALLWRNATMVVTAAASSWKPRSLAVAWMDGRSPVAWPGLVDGALL